MADDRREMMDVLCTALEMKEKKAELYRHALEGCPDALGRKTFQMLLDSEEEHAERIRQIRADLEKGVPWEQACRLVPEQQDLKAEFARVASEQGLDHQICADDVHALESGIKLEDASMRFFRERLEKSKDALELEFLERLIADERQHYILLSDLKFYYTDPKGWFIEKGSRILDGA